MTLAIATLENPHQIRKSIKNSEFQLFGLVLSAAISAGSCWTSYSPKFQYTQYALERSEESHQCRILASTPFFRTTPKDVDGLKEQLIFLTEFSRFMNSKSLSLLWVICINILTYLQYYTLCLRKGMEGLRVPASCRTRACGTPNPSIAFL